MSDENTQPRSRVVGTLVWLAIVLTLLLVFWQTLMHFFRLKYYFDSMGLNLPQLTKMVHSYLSMVPGEVFDYLVPGSYLLVTLVIVCCRHVVTRRRIGVLVPQILVIGLTLNTCLLLGLILLANMKMAEAMARR